MYECENGLSSEQEHEKSFEVWWKIEENPSLGVNGGRGEFGEEEEESAVLGLRMDYLASLISSLVAPTLCVGIVLCLVDINLGTRSCAGSIASISVLSLFQRPISIVFLEQDK